MVFCAARMGLLRNHPENQQTQLRAVALLGFAALPVLLVLISLSSCLLESLPSESCQELPGDQRGSLMPAVDSSDVVTVEVDPAFSLDQRMALEEAVSVWNAFSAQAMGKNLFVTRRVAVTAGQEPVTENDCDFEGSDEATFKVVRQDSSARWKSLGLSGKNPAVTIRCRRGSSLAKQIVLVNTRYVAAQQLASVFLHELGHAIGLDHSCLLGDGRVDYLSCVNLDEQHPYRVAVMYPTLRSNSVSGDFEIKSDLRSNDRTRARCLF